MSFIAELTVSKKKTVTGTSKSIRFLLPPAKIELLDLQAGDLVQIHICGLITEPDQTEPTPVDIPMPSKIIKAGGGSLAITVKKNVRNLYKLEKGHSIKIDEMTVTKRSPRE